MNPTYSILINTCDKFEDCWDPFFKLLSIYWPDCTGHLYLNTEYKSYTYPELQIVATRGCQDKTIKGERATWSQCLRWALDKIDTDIVLYMQEDYFLKDYVKNELVEEYVSLMSQDDTIKCIHLTDQAVQAEGPSKYEHLDLVKCKQRYRVSCQAALWRKEELYALIRDYESAWEFEEFGSKRSAVLGHTYLCVSRKIVKLNTFEIIPYIFTGIIQGRWFEQTVPLFEKHTIQIDWEKRGFVSEAPRKSLIKRIQYRLNKIPKIIRNKVDLYNLQKATRL